MTLMTKWHKIQVAWVFSLNESIIFKIDALYLIFNYLNNIKQRVKTSSSFSFFQNIISGVAQGSLLGALLFNIFLIDILLLWTTEVTSNLDDNTSYAMEFYLKKKLYKM